MAVEAIVSVVLQKVTDMLKGQSLTQNKLLVYEVQEIMKSLDSMRDLIMISTKVVNQQAEEYLQAVYMVEDGIEKFTLNVVRRRKVFGFLTNHIFFFDNLNSCIKIHQNIKNTLTKLKDHEHVPNEGKKEEKCSETRATDHVSFSYSCNEEVMQIVGIKERFHQMKNTSSFSYKEEEMGIFGLRKDVDTVVNQLTNNCEHVVLIVGLGGIGKTTLARTIYKHRDIKQRFQFRVWVSVLEDYATKDILLSVLKAMDSVTEKCSNKDDEETMKFKVSEYLKNTRYLIILDGANNYSNILEDIKEAFPHVRNGSKLVLTSTQNMELKTTHVNLFLHCMMPLSEDDSWKMFKEKVGRKNSWDLVTPESKQAILLSCKGLPLNIVLLAGLFSLTDPNRWSRIFCGMQNSMDVLSLCYNDLSDNLKLPSSLKLLTLWGLFLDKKVPIKDGLDKLDHLRELGITFHLPSNQEDLMNWIANLTDLRSLRLRSKDNLGYPSDLMFRSMSNLGQLSHLNLLGRLEKLPDYNEFPPTLKVLTLSISLLKSDPMETIGQLPCLTVLRLLGQSYIGKEMVCVQGGFSRLKVLKMWMLKELESWVVEEGSMQSLKHLEIRCCEKLHSIPTTLLQQAQLENLVLTGMPQAFATDVERLKSDHTWMTIKQWKFPPLPWEQGDSTLVNHS
ncbi:putative P-loop containing nucleoside triphosphate hydrolase, leucine-rich repeat domain superfamily [Helianthus debilis subsp. tardiflorus]